MSAYVLFFGGYQASRIDINFWSASAKSQKPAVTFDGYPWPAGGGADADDAVSAFKKAGSYDEAIGTIQECATDVVYLVGHSSGCAIANAVDRGLKDTTNVILVALDGFAPSPKQLERPSTRVWAADCGSALSKNYRPLKRALGDRLKVHHATNCKHLWALHFSVVNAAATDGLVTSVATGYTQCKANLMWM